MDEAATQKYTDGSLKSIKFSYDAKGNVDPSQPAYLTGTALGSETLYIKASTIGGAFGIGYLKISSNDCSNSEISRNFPKGFDWKI